MTESTIRVVEPVEHPDYITVTSGMRGYFAVYCRYYADISGYDAWNTSPVSCRTFAEAEKDARYWAMAEGIEYR